MERPYTYEAAPVLMMKRIAKYDRKPFRFTLDREISSKEFSIISESDGSFKQELATRSE